ncbi:hypothetical protein PN497_17070 [Sphaerospermopsis kisseleviana CS-549]|uniref:Uncharacterized protein n=1 Tax=Sphaerospermopsis kisseleviana CS-549 TaxID=3021783 RepID=A0ABT4ZUG3_9CYAN|nr:hypothetical protein [Sphaerospermopsis kisseleviana]MDB9443060.1 hypothetical protein [Sphaerospermopsis kisseleviana CS-549]BAZ78888.1 hypothetical protein NIES73_01250 [Sphaerospermopsis kisseleviana NIES-73]
MNFRDEARKNGWFVFKDLVFLCPCWLLLSFVFISPVFAKNSSAKPVDLKLNGYCSQQSLEGLTTRLMLDLPSYANRDIQRSRRLNRNVDIYPYILVAGKPEFEHLPLNPGINTANNTNKYASEGVEQIFFTTLERQYINKKAVELQQFHWLFLTKTTLGWQVVMMFTQTGEYPVKPPLAPPRDSSQGAIAQGVKLWLRDCEAGSVNYSPQHPSLNLNSVLPQSFLDPV